MPKGMTTSQITTEIASRAGLKKSEVACVLDQLAYLAHEQAHNGFKVPGIGKLVLVDRAARTARNPKTGETVQVPAKKVLKFRIAKSLKDIILRS